jgi:hypothetical protein
MSKKLIREKFRNSVFARDKNKCVFCADADLIGCPWINRKTGVKQELFYDLLPW